MKQYIVIQNFTDLQDGNYSYRIGKPFPREGMTVSPERLEELAGPNNRQHKPLIEALPDGYAENEKPKRRGRKKKVD